MDLFNFSFDDTFIPAPTGVNPFQTPFVPMASAGSNFGVPMPTVLPRRKPSMAALSGFTPLTMPAGASSSPQGRSIPVYANPAASPASMAMPSMLPKPKPAQPTFTPYSQMGAPDFVTAMPKAKLVQPTQTSSTQTPSAPQGGLLGNLLASDITSAKGQGILSAAASLMQAGAPVKGQPAPSLGSAIGGAINAGMGTYQGVKDNEINQQYKKAMTDKMIADLNRPKRTALAGGAYSLVENPDGTTEIVKNEGIQEAILDQKRAEAALDIETAAAKKKAANPLGLSDADKELDKAMAKDLPEKEAALSDWPATKQELIALKGKIDGGGLTGLLGETDFTSTMLSEDEEKARNFLEGLAQKLAKARNGARVTDADVRNAKRSIPSLYLEKEIFDDTIDRLILEFELAEAQAKGEREHLESEGTFKGYEAPTIVNGIVVRKKKD